MRALTTILALALGSVGLAQDPGTRAPGDEVEAAARRLESSLQRADAVLQAMQEQKRKHAEEQAAARTALEAQLATAKQEASTTRAELAREREASTARVATETARTAQLERQLTELQSTSARTLLQKQQEHAEALQQRDARIRQLETERDEAAAREAKSRAEAAQQKRADSEALQNEARRRDQLERELATAKARAEGLAAELAGEGALRTELQRALAELAREVAALRAEVERIERTGSESGAKPASPSSPRRSL